jgi:hypothetical protein
MVSFALTEFDFGLDVVLRGLSCLVEFAGAPPDLFLAVLAVLGGSRPPGFCAKELGAKARMEKA